MNKSWFNHNYKYLLTCVDVFSKKAGVIPLKDREQETVTDAFSQILSNIGIPKTIYSDQGSEFKNTSFQKLLDKHNIQIIFALGHDCCWLFPSSTHVGTVLLFKTPLFMNSYELVSVLRDNLVWSGFGCTCGLTQTLDKQ